MTSTVNGIGTSLSGERGLTNEEFNEWSEHFPFIPGVIKNHYRIATESFVILFPIIPLKTFVFYYTKSGFMQNQYRIIYYPAGEGKVYWKHVKKSWSFYIFPTLMAILMIYLLISHFI